MNQRGQNFSVYNPRPKKKFIQPIVVILILTLLFASFAWVPITSAQDNPPSIWRVQSLENERTGLTNPVGLAFSSRTGSFQVLEGKGTSAAAELIRLNRFAERAGAARITASLRNPINMAHDQRYHRLLLIPGASDQLLEVREGTGGNLSGLSHHNIERWGVQQPQGMTVDQDGNLYILDASQPGVVRVAPGAGGSLENATINRLPLRQALPRGIAFDATTGHLHVMVPAERKLYELSQAGETLFVRELAPFDLNDPQGLVFAPSGDQTDDPSQLSLFVADGASQEASGQIVEFSLVEPAALPPGTVLLPATLVRTFDTSVWNHPSPDPGGIEYLAASNRFLITDSEIEESVNNRPPAYWHGFNVFLSSLSGSQVGTCTTYTSSPVSLAYNNFTHEPTGVAVNGTNGHVFITNDGSNSKLFEIDPGSDGVYCSSDDTVTLRYLSTFYGATDAEDAAYGNNTVYVADGTNAEVWVIPLGPDGVLSGDDGPVTHWDTGALGFHDVEGIGFNQVRGTLFVVSTVGSENYLGEFSTAGNLLRAFDLSFMGTRSNMRSDVVYAPGSQNASARKIYIASRGIDNGSNRLENDGKVWEIDLSSAQTSTPTITPSPTLTSTPQAADLIFADGFESGNLSAWTEGVTDAGDLVVSSRAAMKGDSGLQALIDDNTAIYVKDGSPEGEGRYRARYYFNPNSISMVHGDSFYMFMGYQGSTTVVVRGAFRMYNGLYQVRFGLLNDSGTWQSTGPFTISNSPHAIEIDWRAATSAGANNGGLTLWIDGTQKASLTGVDNDTRWIGRVSLGAVSGVDSNTRGTVYFDAFESRHQTYIGP